MYQNQEVPVAVPLSPVMVWMWALPSSRVMVHDLKAARKSSPYDKDSWVFIILHSTVVWAVTPGVMTRSVLVLPP